MPVLPTGSTDPTRCTVDRFPPEKQSLMLSPSTQNSARPPEKAPMICSAIELEGGTTKWRRANKKNLPASCSNWRKKQPIKNNIGYWPNDQNYITLRKGTNISKNLLIFRSN